MKGFVNKVAALLVVVLNVVRSQELIRFTQCECLNEEFQTDGSVFFQGAFTKQLSQADVSTVQCQPGADINGFPINAGAIFTNSQAERWEADINVVGYFVNAQDQRLATYGFSRVTITAPADTRTLTLFQDATGNTNFPTAVISSTPDAGSVNLQVSFGGDEATIASGIQAGTPVTVDIVAGEQTLTDGANTFLFKYICAKVNGVAVCDTTDVTNDGFADISAGDVATMKIFDVPNQGADLAVDVEFLEFGHDMFGAVLTLNGGSVNTFETAFEAFNRNPAALIETIPTVSTDQLTVAEDGTLSINLFNNLLTGGSLGLNDLTFTVDKSTLGGVTVPNVVDTLNAFTYTPIPDFFGDESFTFAYGNSGLSCFNTGVNVDITVTPEDDEPVAVNPTVEVFGTVFEDLSAGVVVATDVDFANGLLSGGTATISAPLPDGVLSDCEGNNFQVGSALNIENGAISFCFLPADTLVGDINSNFNFVIDDGTTSDTVAGTIIFFGRNPVQALVNENIQTNEDTATTFAASTLGEGQGGISFQVRITRLPNVGTLQNNDGQAAVAVGDEFDENAVFRYVPAANFFNANQDGGTLTEGGVNVDFEYEVFRESVVDGPRSSPIVVRARDDAGTTISNAGEAEKIVNSAFAGADGFIKVKETGLTVESDNGNNVFRIIARIQANGGVKFNMVKPPIGEGQFSIGEGSFGDDDERECGVEQCDEVTFFGTPAQVASVFEDLDIRVPETPEDGFQVGDQTIVFQVTEFGGIIANGPSVSVDYVVEFEEIPFFEKLENQLLVGGIGGGALFILVAFGIYRVTRAREVGETSAMAVAENNVMMDLEKRRNRKRKDKVTKRDFDEDEEAPPAKASSKKAGKTAKADGDPMDWEKHMDPNTKQTYFFNPNTGESRWDPPDV